MDINEKDTEREVTSLSLAKDIVKILDAGKAGQIKMLRVNDKTVMTDYFVISSGTSNTQIKSLSGEVEYKLGEKGIKPLGIDGYETGMWIVMDYAYVMVHIFNREQRDFFKLEKLWADAEEIDIDEFIDKD